MLLQISPLSSFSFLYCYPHLRYLHSFPTRRSSDLWRVFFGRPSTTWHFRPNVCCRHSTRPCGMSGSCSRTSRTDRKSTRLNSSHRCISYAVFCLKKKKKKNRQTLE